MPIQVKTYLHDTHLCQDSIKQMLSPLATNKSGRESNLTVFRLSFQGNNLNYFKLIILIFQGFGQKKTKQGFKLKCMWLEINLSN